MSFRGLDLSPGFGQWADVMREADAEKRAMADRGLKSKIMEQEAALNFGYDSPNVDYIPVSRPGMGGMNREPQGAIFDDYPSFPGAKGDAAEAAFLSEQLGQGTVENPTRKLPTGPRVTGTKGAVDAPPPKGTKYSKGGLMGKAVDDVIKTGPAKAKAVSGALKSERNTELSDVFDEEIQRVIDVAEQTGRMREGKVHPQVYKQIQQLQEMKFKAMIDSGKSSFEQKMMELMMKGAYQKDNQRPQNPPKTPVDPAVKNTLDALKGQIKGFERDNFAAMMNPLTPDDLRKKSILDQVYLQLSAGQISPQQALQMAGMSTGTSVEPPKGTAKAEDPNAGKKLYNGKWYTKEEFKKEFGK
jgi:hypothetical protein